MSDFVPNNRHMREVLIFFFHSKKTAAEAHRELQKVYGDAALSETTCRDWFRLQMLTTVRVKEGQKPSKTLNWRHCSMRICAKRK
ncbi:Mariner Mos1 transposase [Acromyrmex echinatior]|uniref:Mariner Mos1 transposase n=1 Tax=Acromyrmex echinatior TaxID=103372 RepID=F4WJJ1_ACREC|nr:Mariner Mos1 transposase [Acromyrmex echinatior]